MIPTVELNEVIKVSPDNKKDSNNNTYTAFKDIKDIIAIKVKDKGNFILD